MKQSSRVILASFIVFALSFSSFMASAEEGTDSMAIFIKPQMNGVVVVNEKLAAKENGDKLTQLMNAFGAQDKLEVTTTSTDFSIKCSRSSELVSCSFGFKRSFEVEIGDNWMIAVSDTENSVPARPQQPVYLEFANSKGHTFWLELDPTKIVAEARRVQ